MKKIMMGFIAGLLVAGTIVSAGELFGQIEVVDLEKNPIIINLKPWQTEQSVYRIDGSTYVPLRAFCEEAELGIGYAGNPYSPPNETKLDSIIHLKLPFVRDNEVLTSDEFWKLVGEPEETDPDTEEEYRLAREQMVEEYLDAERIPVKIKNKETAAKVAALYLECTQHTKDYYEYKPYIVNYVEKYDAWIVATGYDIYGLLNMKHGGALLIMNSYGDVLYYDITV